MYHIVRRKNEYPNLYNIVRRKNATVTDIFRTHPLNISFRRSLVAENLNSWNHLVLRLAHIHLREQADIFRWSFKYGQFTINSMYQVLLDLEIAPHNSYLWKIKSPLKIKVFLWLLYRVAILTKDNLVKRNWHENEMCSFCNNKEIIQHLFFDCALAKFVWRVVYLVAGLPPPNNIRHMFGSWVCNMNKNDRHIFLVGVGTMLCAIWLSCNDAVFDKIPISSSMQVIFRGMHWTRTCATFQKEVQMKTLQIACRMIESPTMEIFATHGWWSINKLSY
jgi:hypothetical protein